MLYTALRWCVTVFMLLCAIIWRFSLSSVLFLLCALLVLPIKKWQEWVHKAVPPSWLRILLLAALFLYGAVIAPDLDTNKNSDVSLPVTDETQRSSIHQSKESEIQGGSLESKLDELKDTKTETELETEASGTEIPVYSAGQYKVGTDIPADVYYIYADTDKWYSACKLTKDANGNDYVLYESFDTNYIVEVKDGEYFELSNSYAIPYEYAPVAEPEDGYLYEGFYVVGADIPAGEYKVEAYEDATWASFAIYADLRDDLEDYESVEGKRYIELQEGQYVKLSDCKIYIGE